VTSRRVEWHCEITPALEALEQFCVEFQIWRAAACADLDAFSSELLLREALTNSVVHANSKASTKSISCLLRVKPGRLLIAIDDQGEGFDWRAALDRQPDLSDTHGRGIGILTAYSSRVRFNSKGSSVTLIKKFGRGL
jgi:anti-sigma regulatory factor (Ser/Thr protein kinase)